MRKLLTCTTALSLALSPLSGVPVRAQTLAEDGSVIGPDGSILCTPSEGAPCDLESIRAQLAAQAAADAAAQAEAEAAARAEAEAAAAAQAEAEAEAAARAEAEAAAQAAAEEAAEIEAEARAAEEAAAAAAAAEAAARAEAEAAAKAAEDAAARAEAEAQAAAEAEAAAEAAAAEEPAAEPAPEVVAEEPAAEPAPEVVAEEPAAEPAPEVVAEEPAAEPAPEVVAEEPAAEPAPEVVAEEPAAEPAPEVVAEEPAAEFAPEVVAEEPAAEPAPEVATEEPAAEPATETVVEAPAAVTPTPETAEDASVAASAEAAPAPAEGPVDIPEVPAEASESLAGILATPPAAEGGSDEAVLPAAAAAAAAAAVIDPETLLPVQPDQPADGAAAPAAPLSVATEVVTDQTTRSSAEEFAPAPVAASKGKKSGLSDLEKVGLLALGALVVGAVINEGKKDQREVVQATGDRVVVRNPDGSYEVYKDDDAVLRRPGVKTVTETYRDGSTRTVVVRPDGTQVATVRDAAGRVLRRSVFDRDGIETVLIDDLYPEDPIIVSDLPRPKPGRVTISTSDSDYALKAELAALEAQDIGRKFSLRQIREVAEVRALAAMIEVDSITFDSGSSAIDASEARKLADLGKLMQGLLADNPRHVFLIEGHTDAVGSAASNLLLSDRRAESLALALNEYFEVPPENLVVQGYGESELKIDTQGDERANRRVVVRLITPLMRSAELR